MTNQTSLQPIRIEEILPLKSEISTMSQMIISAVENGVIEAPALLVKLKFLSEVFGEVKSNLEGVVRDLAEKENGKMEVLGAKVECAETGTKYDYSKDPIWLRLQDEMKPIQDKVNERESILKVMKSPLAQTDDSTGEVFTAYPAIKTSKSSIKISLGK